MGGYVHINPCIALSVLLSSPRVLKTHAVGFRKLVGVYINGIFIANGILASEFSALQSVLQLFKP